MIVYYRGKCGWRSGGSLWKVLSAGVGGCSWDKGVSYIGDEAAPCPGDEAAPRPENGALSYPVEKSNTSPFHKAAPFLGKGRPWVIAFAGAGGKTSLIRRLAAEGRRMGLKVLVTTTTHMYRPLQFGVVSKDVREVEEMLESRGIAVAGEPSGNEKIGYPGPAFYSEICSLADLVLVEADGSRGLPLKVPGPGEPVVPDNADQLLCAAGLSALGQPGEETAFRLEQVKGLLKEHKPTGYEGRRDKDTGWRVTPEIMGTLMEYGYLRPMRQRYPAVETLPVFNQADTPELAALGMEILEGMGSYNGFVTGHTNAEEGSALF